MLLFYKSLSLQIYHGQIRLKGGWCYNPAGLGFRCALKSMVLMKIDPTLGYMSNCQEQDINTTAVPAQSSGVASVSQPDTFDKEWVDEHADLPNEPWAQHVKKCQDPSCHFGYWVASYYASDFVRTLSKLRWVESCQDCLDCLHHSKADPLEDKSFLVKKALGTNYTRSTSATAIWSRGGLVLPSGSVVRLLRAAERRLGYRQASNSHAPVPDRIVKDVLMSYQTANRPLFVNNDKFHDPLHTNGLAHALLTKYVAMRVRTIMNLDTSNRGAYLHRCRQDSF